jgi:ATP phosphoribosyltransferase
MNVKIAIQKSGRLFEDSVRLLKECGIGLSIGPNKLKSEADNFPMEIFFLRDDDIPQYVQDGVADIGIVGENVLLETKNDTQIIERLGFGKCRLAIAVQRGDEYTDTAFLQGKRIATSYPNILKSFLDERGIQSDIHVISGSVEIAPGIGLADAICDLVSSGSTLFTNGLKEAETVMKSEAVLIRKTQLSDEKLAIIDKLLWRIRAVAKAKKNKYIILNAPNDRLEEIYEILPGMKSPTVVSLAIEGWSSIQSLIEEDDFWQIIDKLKEKGAEGILVVPIEKMII